MCYFNNPSVDPARNKSVLPKLQLPGMFAMQERSKEDAISAADLVNRSNPMGSLFNQAKVPSSITTSGGNTIAHAALPLGSFKPPRIG